MRMHLLFGVVLAGAFVGLDYVNESRSAPGAALSFPDYARDRAQAARDALLGPTAPAPDAAAAVAVALADGAAPPAAPAAPPKAGGFSAMVSGFFGSGEVPEEADSREARQEALIAAAQSGNAATAGALAALEFNAIAAELGRTEMKAAPAAAGGAAQPSSRRRKNEITIGIGTCGDRSGAKFCSAIETGTD